MSGCHLSAEIIYFPLRKSHLYLLVCNIFCFESILPRGLTARISGFHPGGPGSTPGVGIHFFLSSFEHWLAQFQFNSIFQFMYFRTKNTSYTTITYYINESILTIDHKKVAITGSRIGPKNTKRFYLGSFPMCKFRTKIQKLNYTITINENKIKESMR